MKRPGHQCCQMKSERRHSCSSSHGAIFISQWQVSSPWITRCLYDHLYPTFLNATHVEASELSLSHFRVPCLRARTQEIASDSNQQLWVAIPVRVQDKTWACLSSRGSRLGPCVSQVPQGGFLPMARIARQHIEFPPYLVKVGGFSGKRFVAGA